MFPWHLEALVLGIGALIGQSISRDLDRLPFVESGQRRDCPPNFDRYTDGSCAHFSGRDMAWRDAVAYCERLGSKLLEVHSKYEQDYMVQYLTSHHISDVWLAGSDGKTEGDWEWQSGFPFNYNGAWNSHEPSNGTRENCIEIQDENDYLWNDEPCDHARRCGALCRTCRRDKHCPPNQRVGHDECCQCKKKGFIKVPDTEVCVGQSSYSRLGEPEYIYDGNDGTFMHTGTEEYPWVHIDLPAEVKIVSVAFKLRKNVGGYAFCSREHDIEIYTGNDMKLCGVYRGTKRGENCDGKMQLVTCNHREPSSYIWFKVTNKEVKRCSEALEGEVCVSDLVYLGKNTNVIHFAEVSFSTA